MNPSYFYVNYRGTRFWPNGKIQQNDKQMTSCLEKNAFFATCKFVIFLSFLWCTTKAQTMTKSDKFAGCKKCIVSRHCHLFAILLYFLTFWWYVRKKWQSFTNDKQIQICRLQNHIFLEALSFFCHFVVMFCIFWSFLIFFHTHIHTYTNNLREMTNKMTYQNSNDKNIDKQMANKNDRPKVTWQKTWHKMTDQNWNDKNNGKNNDKQMTYFNHLQGMATSFF